MRGQEGERLTVLRYGCCSAHAAVTRRPSEDPAFTVDVSGYGTVACEATVASMTPRIFTTDGMGLQFPPGNIVMLIGDDGRPHTEVNTTTLRIDLWTTWLEIGCEHAGRAAQIGARFGRTCPTN